MISISWWGWCLMGLALVAVVSAGALAFRAWLRRRMHRSIASYQNELMARHLEEVQHIYRQMRGWRHDYHNHIQIMKAYQQQGEYEQLNQYLDKLDGDLVQVDTLIRSGNIMVDAILNSKLSLAQSRHIPIKAKAIVPARLNVSDLDLCVILGNLIDNAVEASLKLPETERLLRVYVDVKKGSLYLSVTNTAKGRPAKHGGRYVTTKGGFHGLGLARVDALVEKYGGYVKRRDEDGAFSTEVLLPLPAEGGPVG